MCKERDFEYKRQLKGSNKDNRTPKSQAPPLTPQPCLLDFLFKPPLPVWSPWGEAAIVLQLRKTIGMWLPAAWRWGRANYIRAARSHYRWCEDWVKQAFWETRPAALLIAPLLLEGRQGSLKKEEPCNQTWPLCFLFAWDLTWNK